MHFTTMPCKPNTARWHGERHRHLCIVTTCILGSISFYNFSLRFTRNFSHLGFSHAENYAMGKKEQWSSHSVR